jgi:uncharacterized protein YwgA
MKHPVSVGPGYRSVVLQEFIIPDTQLSRRQEVLPVQVNKRELLPLTLLAAADGEISGRTRMQKLAFLLDEEELDDEDFYKFVKYDYGPFSKQLLNDLDRLEREGVIEEEESKTFSGNRRYDYRLSDEFADSVERLAETDDEVAEIVETARQVVREHNDKSIRALVEHVYDKHPKYKENSVYKR